jgi:hypothetical protein
MAKKSSKGRGSTQPTSNPKALKDLQQDPKNARRHTVRNLTMIGESLDAVGAGRSLVIDEGGRILAGNATQREALARGLKLKVVDADKNTLVAVRRTDLTAAQKQALGIYDNRAAELAEWDAATLRALVKEQGTDALASFFTGDELKLILLKKDPADGELLDESVADQVEHATCPKCGKTFPL